MSEAVLEWQSYRYFPYEREFARREVESLLTPKAREYPSGLRIPAHAFSAEKIQRLTYFARGVHPQGAQVVPDQARLEASAHPDQRDRQATRYSAHGLHEYKGKFNPQVVRAIANILGIEDDGWILDPFCGSGTTLLEAAHAGWNAIGVDRNPLAVRIANAKTRALRQARRLLEERLQDVLSVLEPALPLSTDGRVTSRTIEAILGDEWILDLPCPDYLRSWFPAPVLAQLVAILRALRAQIPTAEDRAVFETVLSDLLREVSLQEPADLRIRRRKETQPNYPLITLTAAALQERLQRVARARSALGRVHGHQRAHLGDIRTISLKDLPGAPPDGFDAVITSPPYETALPYIDTQRLSLVILGEIQAREIPETERALVGAREINTSERKTLEQRILDGENGTLPSDVYKLCRQMLSAARRPENGFRRRNRPALTYRYFLNMAEFFRNIRPAMKKGGKIALVVGTNRTSLGGQEFEIETPRLLASIASEFGYELLDQREMDTYQRYDIHQQNSIRSESLIILAAP